MDLSHGSKACTMERETASLAMLPDLNGAAFDACPDRRASDSMKWNRYAEDVLPLWVADMDVRSPRAVIEALEQRVGHGVFGYGQKPQALAELIAKRMWERYEWRITPEDVVFTPGVMPAANLACLVTTKPGDAVALQTPLYPPLRRMPKELERRRIELELRPDPHGVYVADWDEVRAEVAREQVKLFVLCNPHNPTGRVFGSVELERLAEICLAQGVFICSDEIHSDIVDADHWHVPIAALNPEIAARTITLMAPSKTFNLAGLGCAFAIIQNTELRTKLRAARGSLVPDVDILGYVAATAAYAYGESWLERVLGQVFSNRDVLIEYIRRNLPGVVCLPPQGTYLAWLDCRNAGLPERPFDFFLSQARVGLNDGVVFGSNAHEFVRLNFACSRSTLMAALERMRAATLRCHRNMATP